ncbi:MAG: hypothetical protein J0M29_07010 [Chitinophagales bacterium]|nr:hypothetical protein [Chitinophagales bacterium]
MSVSRNSILIVFLLLHTAVLCAQKAPRFAKTPVGDSGASIYLPGAPTEQNVSYSPDSSRVYTIETVDSTQGAAYHFGAIVVNLNHVDLKAIEEDMLTQYMDYLKETFDVKQAVGYGKGHTLDTHPSAKGMLDYWLDGSGSHWAVKGWAAESTLFVLFIYGPEDYPNVNVAQLFLNGARFAGD